MLFSKHFPINRWIKVTVLYLTTTDIVVAKKVGDPNIFIKLLINYSTLEKT